jgi:hypothetical protein
VAGRAASQKIFLGPGEEIRLSWERVTGGERRREVELPIIVQEAPGAVPLGVNF